jgi:hypothetical protein
MKTTWKNSKSKRKEIKKMREKKENKIQQGLLIFKPGPPVYRHEENPQGPQSL